MDATVLVRASAIALILGFAGCDRSAPPASRPGQASGQTPDPAEGYRAPPRVGGLSGIADGVVALSGRAQPSWTVRMESPAGVMETTADGSGAWTTSLGPVSEPALYSLVEQRGKERVEAEGLVAVLPGAPTVALLRAGYGAEVQGSGEGGPRLLAVDYDMGGGTVVSGRAAPASPVRLLVDDQTAIEGSAGADGRFSLTLPKPLAPGRRKLQLLTPGGGAGAEVAITPPSMPKEGAYDASSQPFGWRVDWVTPGGGLQTTLLLGR